MSEASFKLLEVQWAQKVYCFHAEWPLLTWTVKWDCKAPSLRKQSQQDMYLRIIITKGRGSIWEAISLGEFWWSDWNILTVFQVHFPKQHFYLLKTPESPRDIDGQVTDDKDHFSSLALGLWFPCSSCHIVLYWLLHKEYKWPGRREGHATRKTETEVCPRPPLCVMSQFHAPQSLAGHDLHEVSVF